MIPLTRPTLEDATNEALYQATRKIEERESVTRIRFARDLWSTQRSVRRQLKYELEQIAHRPAFCMYCYESRGTDVDHFEPIKVNALRAFWWPNHILACGFCNQQSKREQFPLNAQGLPLLIDPFIEDSWDHLRQGPSGQLYPLSEMGEATLEVLRLNARKELVEARRVSWAYIAATFNRLRSEKSVASLEDLADLRFLPIVDSLHYFAHDAAAGLLGDRAISSECADFVIGSLAALRLTFPTCQLDNRPTRN